MTLIEQIKDLINRVENARNFDGSDGKWVTIKGTHVFIPDGKSVEEVIEEKGWGSENKGEGEKSELPDHSKLRTMDKEELIKTYLIDKDSLDPEDDLKFYKQFSQSKLLDKIYEKDEKKKQVKDVTKEEHAKIKEQVSKMSDDELVKAHFEAQKGYESEKARAGSLSKHEATYGLVAQELKKRTGRSFSASSTEREIKEALKQQSETPKEEKGETSTYKQSLLKEYKAVKEQIRKEIVEKAERANKILEMAKENPREAKFHIKHVEDIHEEIKGLEEQYKYTLEQLENITKMKADNSLEDAFTEALAEIILEQ